MGAFFVLPPYFISDNFEQDFRRQAKGATATDDEEGVPLVQRLRIREGPAANKLSSLTAAALHPCFRMSPFTASVARGVTASAYARRPRESTAI